MAVLAIVAAAALPALPAGAAAQRDTAVRAEPRPELGRMMPPEIWDASALAVGDTTEARRLAELLWREYGRALLLRDPEAVAAWFADDAHLMEPDRPDLRGREEILGFLREAFGMVRVTEVRIHPREAVLTDGRLWEMGDFVETVEPDGEPPASGRGRYAAIWERQTDGSWRIFRLLLNHEPDEGAG